MRKPKALSHHHLSIHHFSESGLIRPPWVIYLTLIYLSRALVVFAGAFGIGSNSDAILKIFYGNFDLLYLDIGIATLAIFCWVTLAHREWLIEHAKGHWLKTLRPLLYLTLAIDFGAHIWKASQLNWQFSIAISTGVILPMVLIVFLWNSKTLPYFWLQLNDLSANATSK